MSARLRVLGLLGAAALVVAVALLPPRLDIGAIRGPGADPSHAPVDLTAEQLAARLAEAGLHRTGLLDDLGIDDHMQRLASGAVDAATLAGYARDLDTIRARSARRGAVLPPPFFDVETRAMRDAGWTVYTLAAALAGEAGHVHLDLLSDAYALFLDRRPDALGAALAILARADAYTRALPEEDRIEHARIADSDAASAILVWQALLSGTSRANPVTHRPLWSHGFVGHFSVPKIHQYATGEAMSVSEVWGVGGFAPRFVGPASNANQVEHLGISTVLQAVMGVGHEMLDAVEMAEVLIDGEDPGAAAADDALNRAIHAHFVPLFARDLAQASDDLGRVLSGSAGE